jgi:hypothetical protein
MGHPENFFKLFHMKSVLIEIDNDTAARLDDVAPARSRRHSEFIRTRFAARCGSSKNRPRLKPIGASPTRWSRI